MNARLRNLGRRRPTRVLLLILLSLGTLSINDSAASPRRAGPRVLRVAELNTKQILALDRTKTVVLLPGGILEEHGPYLPSFADGYLNEYLARELAKAIAARPGWTAVVFPTIPLGSGGANEIGGKYSFPGTYAVRPETLRAVFMDLAAELGEQGFQWIFLIHAHGSPDHNRALDQAGDYFRDTYGGHMVHLEGLLPDKPRPDATLKAAIGSDGMAEDGFTVHAGAWEQSMVWHLRPDLVPGGVVKARPVTAHDVADLVTLASAKSWPGYFGSPRRASASLGEQLLQEERGALLKLAMEILDGQDEREIRRYSDFMYSVPGISEIMQHSRDHDGRRRQQEQEWLSGKGQGGD